MEMEEVIAYGDAEKITVQIECPHCGEIHTHGRETLGNTDLGHRLSHCLDSNNPGYLIIDVKPLDEMPPIRTEKRRKLHVVQ